MCAYSYIYIHRQETHPQEQNRFSRSSETVMAAPASLVFALSLTLALCVCSIKADVSITLRNMSGTGTTTFTKYQTTEFFKTRYANTDSTMVGYLHQPVPRNGCSHIPPIPAMYLRTDDNRTVNWIAVVEDYPVCVRDMVGYVRNAGYKLLITSSPNDTYFHLTNEARNMGFPIIVIQDYYMHDLVVENAFSDFANPEVQATVKTGMQVFVTVLVIVFGMVFLLACCCCCLCCVWWVVRRRRRRFQHENRNMEQRRRNYSRMQNRDQMARQELIESILRQLQQLQLDGQAQRPLGSERTRQLPTGKYGKLVESSQEACAICVEDFKNEDLMRLLPCNHHFHLECIDEWLINHSDLCPLCKKQVPNPAQVSAGARWEEGARKRE